MNLRHIVRMSRLARRPPSMTKVKMVAAILAVSLALVAVEKFIGWPDALTVEKPKRIRMVN